MKAVLCKAFGPAETLVLEEIASPEAKKNEVLLQVHAAGVNFPDTLIIEGKYQFKPPFPFSPGGEAAGVVTAVGEKVSHLKVGDRVMALTGWGSFAEEVAVPGYNVMPIPANMDFASAAAFGMTYGTSMHALKQRANLQPGETLLVLGASGGVGLAAVEIGKAMGARVIAAASSAEKCPLMVVQPGQVPGTQGHQCSHDRTEDKGAQSEIQPTIPWKGLAARRPTDPGDDHADQQQRVKFIDILAPAERGQVQRGQRCGNHAEQQHRMPPDEQCAHDQNETDQELKHREVEEPETHTQHHRQADRLLCCNFCNQLPPSLSPESIPMLF